MTILGTIASSTRQGQVSDTGAMFPLQAINVVNSATTTITFSNIPSTYASLQLRGIARQTGSGSTAAGTGGLLVRFNSDSGSNYANHVLYGTGASALSGGSASQTQMSLTNFPLGGNTANAFGLLVCDILDYANTNKYKTVRTLGGYDGNDTNGIVTLRSDLWMSTNAVNSLSILVSNNANVFFAPGTQFALYGVKSA